MDVKTLCLGILTAGEASGYDIKKYFECTFRHFAVAGYGSIYPALAELTEKGLVTCREEPQTGRPARKIYRLTGDGRKAFEDSLVRTPPRHKVRSEFLVLMYFAHLLPPERLDAIFDERLADIHSNIEMLEDYRQQIESGEERVPTGVEFGVNFGLALNRAAKDEIHKHRDRVVDGARRGEDAHIPPARESHENTDNED